LRSRAQLLRSRGPVVRRSLRPGVRSRVRCSGSGLRSSGCSGVLRSGRSGVSAGLCADLRRSGVRPGVRSSELLRSRRSGVLRSGSCGLLRSFELLRQQPRLRPWRRHVQLVQEAVPPESRLRTLVLLRSGSQLLRSGSELLRSGSELRCSVRCLQLM
jgi:hypothetical protein